ncbi:MAG: L-aspartate oxidase [Planctomycetes bacterium]|nr:L-aspartate oxidase [Planctomycetota bacterium]
MDRAYLKRRYLVSFEARRLPHIFTDVLVIGGGAAGLRAAIEAAKYGQALMIVKSAMTESNSSQAQGGIAAVLDERDSPALHVADTLAVGADLCDERVVEKVVGEAADHICELVEWGALFDSNGERFDLAREGGHSQRRIVHAHGDATGWEIIRALLEKARQTDRLKIFDHCFVLDLLTDPVEGGPGSACVGAICWHQRYGLQMIWARQTILASGGAGALWRETTNPPQATADGLAIAFRAGVTLADMEMMQFHPTALYIAGASRSLISEAVRGEGGKLVDKFGRRFMGDYHSDCELAPRDVVARAILSQMLKTAGTHVSLDVSQIGVEQFAKRFPRITEQCLKFGIEPGWDLIPVRPAAHYMIGGAHVDIEGRTGLERLYSCGESACTGLHGANRLGSNSLIEALVFGRQCGRGAGESLSLANDKLAAKDLSFVNEPSQRTEMDVLDIRNSLRALMWRNVGPTRTSERLAETLEIIDFWCRYVLDKQFDQPCDWEVQNMLTAARLIAASALKRTESRGVHFREDFPDTDPAWRRHLFVSRQSPP